MDIKQIYEYISIDGFAEYQIKVKGDIQQLKKILGIYQTIQVTSESADPEHHISMITIKTNQQKLFVFVNMLIGHHFPVISVACSNVQLKKRHNRPKHNSPAVAGSN